MFHHKIPHSCNYRVEEGKIVREIREVQSRSLSIFSDVLFHFFFYS